MTECLDIGLYLRTLLAVPPDVEESFQFLVPIRKQRRHSTSYTAFRSWILQQPEGQNPGDALTRLKYMDEISKNNPRPSTVLKATTGMFNCLDLAYLSKKELQSRISSEMIKKRTTLLPSRKRGNLDLGKCVPTLEALPRETWIEIRNRAMLSYPLCTGRRTSNAASAKFPPEENILFPFGILIQELGSKNDAARGGNSMFFPPSKNEKICVMTALHDYIRHPTTLQLVMAYRLAHQATAKECPLFLYHNQQNNKVKAIRSNTIASQVKRVMKDSGTDIDSAGRRVTPRDVRSRVFSRGIREGIPPGILKQVQAYKSKDIQEARYLEEGCPVGWIDWVLGLSQTCPYDDDSWVNVDTQSRRRSTASSITPLDSVESATKERTVLRITLKRTEGGYKNITHRDSK